MDFQVALQPLLYAAGGIVAFIIWLIRLEGKVSQEEKLSDLLSKRCDKIEAEQNYIDSKVAEKLSLIEVELAQIKGYLMNKPKGRK